MTENSKSPSPSPAPAPEASQDLQPQTDQQEAGSGEALNDDQVGMELAFQDSTPYPRLEDGEVRETGEWCKIFCRKNEAGQEYYFSNVNTGESRWEEPKADYWLWDFKTGAYHVSGLQKPTPKVTLDKEQAIRDEEKDPMNYDEKDPANGWQGFNSRVHGAWDKDAPYVAYHNWLAYAEALEANPSASAAQPTYQTYDSTAQFNAHTGRYQTADQSTDRYDSSNRAGRQMNHFFDVDSAANAHDGRSLKEERRNNKPSKKEVAEMNQRRKDKKHAKRMAFLKS